MPQLDGVLQFFDSRSFASVWFWIFVAALWTWAGRAVLGVPHDVVARAHVAASPDGHEAMALLDWLSLHLPRLLMQPRETVWTLAGGAFALTSLLVLGLVYGLELAQATFLLALPFAVLTWLRQRLAWRLYAVLTQAQRGEMAPSEAARLAIRALRRHRVWFTLISFASVTVTAIWGAIFALLHPFGM